MKVHPTPHTRSHGGFTLVELLVVMSIIISLLAIGANYMKKPDEGHRLTGATAASASVFQAARGVAITRNTTVRVLVNDDPSDTENYRRQILTLYSTLNDKGEETWNLEDKPLVLPVGIYYDGEKSQNQDGTPVPKKQMADYKFGAGPEWFCYSFASNGASQEPGMRFVVGLGVADPGAGQIRRPNEYAVSGFVLRRAGSATMFRDPSQILTPN